MPTLINQVEALTGLSGLQTVFDDMKLAEDEIAQYQAAYPDHAQAIWDSFILLRRPAGMVSDPLYRQHIRELLRRVMANEDCRPATNAELLQQLSNTSMQVKLNRLGILVVAQLMEGLFPENKAAAELVQQLRVTTGSEDYPGEVAEQIASLKQRQQVGDRKPKR